jgi:uncharacterized protein (TIGR03086 family)
MPGAAGLFERASASFGERVAAVTDDQWHLPTPCAEWDVRSLVNHLVYENRWAVPLVEGQTVEDVGDQFDGDLLGDQPLASWQEAVGASVRTISAPGVAERTVHVSFGDIPGDDYVAQLVIDHTIHGWDLARAIGADDRLDPDLVEFAIERLTPQVEEWRAAGAFGAKVEAPPSADRQTQLLALTGRAV